MKICNLDINNYKQFKSLKLDLTYPSGHKKEGQPLDKICIIGQSGTGKTNLLDIIKKSVVDFSENKYSYQPFKEFSDNGSEGKYISNEFITKSNLKVKTLFTESKSEIDFEKTNKALMDDTEKNYFIGTKDYSIFNEKIEKQEELNTFEMTVSDKALLDKLTTAKAELTFEQINESKNPYLNNLTKFAGAGISYYTNNLLEPSPKEKLNNINSAIRDLEAKYLRSDNVNSSLKKIKKKNFIDRYIININNELDNLWDIMKKKIDNYQSLRSEFIDTLSNKLLNDDTYTKNDYKIEIAKWEEQNENLLNNISFEINDILNKFNLELAKIDENQTSYNSFTIKDLSNGNIIEYDKLSTGTKNLLSTFIPLKTYSPQDSIILIDEPEMSFYPDIQRELTSLYSHVGNNNQLIVATHSPLIASSFEPWEIVELKFDDNNQVYRELYFTDDHHIKNYFLDPRYLTWTSILTDIFDLDEDSNFTFREKGLMAYATLKAEIKIIDNLEEKEEKFKELQKLSEKLGLNN